jgi:hypothetical protein
VRRREWELHPGREGGGIGNMARVGGREGKGIITRDHFVWGYANVGRSIAKEELGKLSRD